MGVSWLDLEHYPRREHFNLFRTMAYPYAGVSVEVEAGDLVRLCRQRGESFYLCFLHAAALAADSVPELRRRIRGSGIVEYDACPTSHIELLEDETYCYCTLHHHMPLEQYLTYAKEQRRLCRAKGSIEEDGDPEGMYFISTLPWLSYTALLQPVSCGNDSNPRITWGRYQEKAGGAITLPVSLLVHHALADGVHIARFYAALDRELEVLCSGLSAPTSGENAAGSSPEGVHLADGK